MPEARDRTPRQEDVLTTYINERLIVRNSEVPILEDQIAESPFRWRDAPMVGTPVPIRFTRRIGGIGTPRTGRSPAFGRSASPVVGRESRSPVVGSGHRRGRGSTILPAWYPRNPLRDITSVTTAIQRRKAREEEEGEGLEAESHVADDPQISTSEHAQLEMTSPLPMVVPPTIGEVSEILLEGDSTHLTPQRKLLSIIEELKKLFMEEINQLRRTPGAKRADRQRRARMLMSFR